MINFTLIPYFMLSCFLTGMHFKEYLDNRDGKDNVFLIALSTFIILFICPVLYVFEFIKYLYKKIKPTLTDWYHYLFKFDEKFNKEMPYLIIRDKFFPKSKGLNRILLKLIIKKYEKLNNTNPNN